MRKNARVYLVSISLALGIVLSFFLIQTVFVHGYFKPSMVLLPLALGVLFGALLGKVRVLHLRLAEHNQLFSALADIALEFIYFRKTDGKYEYVSPSCEALTGYTQADFYRQANFMDRLIHPDDARNWNQRVQIKGEDEAGMAEFRIITRDGRERWIQHMCSVVKDREGNAIGVRSSNVDITERKQAEEQLRIAAVAFESQQSMMVTDANCVILQINQAFTESTGYSAEEAVGQTPRLLKSGHHNEAFYREMWQTINQTGGWRGEIWDRRKNGESYPKWLVISAVKGDDGAVTHYVGTHFDITERKKAEGRIRELAYFDQLTGLPNRTLLLDRLKQAMTASGRSGGHCALLFIDLDDFKTLNDTLGHYMGDLLLKQVARRLKMCVREGDTVARLGGDEFVVVLTGLDALELNAAADTEAVTEKILATLNQTYQLEKVAHHSTASIGATLFMGSLVSIEDLMKETDLCMYKAKAAGRNTFRFFDPAMEVAVRTRAALEEDLRGALEAKQFLLYYQAQVTGDRLTGAEALVRWQHPQRGMVSPAMFIPLAEETGAILPLGQWVLETACAHLARWAAMPEMADLTVAVNVSIRQFRQHDFVERVLGAIDNTGANPRRLKLELTESLFVHDVDEIAERMFVLKASGVRFSIDDFGTGYSSLSYLKRLPLDQLKIDRSFVRDILDDPNDAAIARTVVTLAKNLEMSVIAEGVETAEQRDFLASCGCPAYQGYFFSPPLPMDGFEEFVQRSFRVSEAETTSQRRLGSSRRGR